MEERSSATDRSSPEPAALRLLMNYGPRERGLAGSGVGRTRRGREAGLKPASTWL